MRAVTVEPVFLLYMFSTFLFFPTLQQFIYFRQCRENYDEDMCTDLSKHPKEEDLVQKHSSKWYMWLMAVGSVPAIFSVFLLGSWSDKVGRKIVMVLPAVGSLLNAVMFILTSLCLVPFKALLPASVVSGLLGGFTTMTFAVLSYMSDITGLENRTKRLGILSAMQFIGYTFGTLLSGLMIKYLPLRLRFVTVFSLIALILIVDLVYIVFGVEESLGYSPTPPQQLNQSALESQRPESRNRLAQLFQLDNLKKALKILVKERRDYKRLHLILSNIALFLFQLVAAGEANVVIFYTKKAPLSWNPDIQGYFLFYKNALVGLGLILAMLVVKRAHVRDTNAAIFGFLLTSLSYLLMAFSRHTWMMMLVPLLSWGLAIPAATIRSLLSKTVEVDEQGTLFSIMSSIETATVLVSSLLFNNLYNATYSFLEGGYVFIIMAALLLLGAIIAHWVGFSIQWVEKWHLRQGKDDPTQPLLS